MARLTVSLCIPTHGRPRYLLEALESGLTQTRLPNEIVVSDDMGTEETRALVASFAGRASFPVRYLHCTTGQGQAGNVNHCLQQAASDLILLLHDDDLLMPRAIEAMASAFEENPALVGAYGRQLIITETGEEQLENSEALNRSFHRDAGHAGLQTDAVLAGIWQQFPNDGYMVKSSVAREILYRPECGAGTDFDFGLRMSKQGPLYYVDEYTAKYRISAQSVGRGAGRKTDDCAYYEMLILLRLLETDSHYEAEIASKLREKSPMAIYMAINKGKLNEAVDWYLGSYHRGRIFTMGGIRRGLLLAKAWLRQKLVRAA